MSLGSDVRDRVRALLDGGELPKLQTGKCVAGRGAGLACTVCGEAITATEVEYKIDGQVATVHPACFIVWLSESRTHGDSSERLAI
jgi:hypothetical protein